MLVLNNCPSGDITCLHGQRLTTSAGFFGSPEFHLKGYFVYRFYRAAFGRLPDYSEISADIQSVTGETPSDVYSRKATFANGFVQRPEFIALYNSLSNADYVAALFSKYGISSITTPDPTQPDSATKVMMTQAELVNDFREMVRGFVDSIEYRSGFGQP